MPNKNTFTIPPIKKLLEKYVSKNEKWIDGFANGSKLATITNDLNPEFNTDYHMDALDFFKIFESNSIDGVLYDPPYSLRQVVECYKGVGVPITREKTQSNWRTKHINELMDAYDEGYGAGVLFVLQMENMKGFSPAYDKDPLFSSTLYKAQKHGVKVMAYECAVTEHSLDLTHSVPVTFHEERLL